MHDSFNPQVGNFQPALLGNFQPVLTTLPEYDISRIRTGQFLVNEDGFYTNIWEGEIRFDE